MSYINWIDLLKDGGRCADLRDANLSGANFNLRDANLPAFGIPNEDILIFLTRKEAEDW